VCVFQSGSAQEVDHVLDARKACVNACASDGCTALHAATQGGHEDVIQLLLDSNAIVDAVSAVSCLCAESDGNVCVRAMETFV
jgi:hypothetical protein